MIFTREKEVGNPFAVLLEKRWPVSQQFNGENGVAKCRKQFCLVADNGFLDFGIVNFVFILLMIYKPQHCIVNNFPTLPVRSFKEILRRSPNDRSSCSGMMDLRQNILFVCGA